MKDHSHNLTYVNFCKNYKFRKIVFSFEVFFFFFFLRLFDSKTDVKYIQGTDAVTELMFCKSFTTFHSY